MTKDHHTEKKHIHHGWIEKDGEHVRGCHDEGEPCEICDPMTHSVQTEPLESQIDRLAKFIMDNIPGEPSQSEGAIDTAIRLLKQAQMNKAHSKALFDEVEREVIGEDEVVKQEEVKTVDGSYDVTEDLSISRNELRAQQRQKLTELRKKYQGGV